VPVLAGGESGMQKSKRLFIKGLAALSALAVLPRAALAAVWPQAAFSKDAASAAMTELFGTDQTTQSDQITLRIPEIAENGAVVPVTISTTLDNVESISIVVENNPRPLVASFEMLPGTLPEVSCRIKMGQTSDVMAVVKTSTGLYSTAKEVKVTIGGCGG
jgi:sulfur-oxidizing protein SoxY